MATAATVNAYVDAAIVAIGAGDWATALTKLRQAWAALVGIPDSTLRGETEIKYDREAIKGLIENAQSQQAATIGIQTSKITYARPTDA